MPTHRSMEGEIKSKEMNTCLVLLENIYKCIKIVKHIGRARKGYINEVLNQVL